MFFASDNSMTTLELLLTGFAVGVLAAFPLGPVGMLCLERAQSRGVRSGIVSASGMALASALWCLAVVQGLRQAARYLPLDAGAFRLLLGLVLAGLAAKNLLRKPGPAPQALRTGELAGQFTMSFILVLANPLTPATVLALLAAFGLARERLVLGIAAELAGAVLVGGVALWVAIGVLVLWWQRRFRGKVAGAMGLAFSYCALALGISYILAAIIGWVR